MEHINAHLPPKDNGKRKTPERGKKRVTERGELMEYFMERLNATRVRDGLAPLTMSRMGKVLEAIPTKDLYYLRRVCDEAPNFSKKFWWEVNPKKHESE